MGTDGPETQVAKLDDMNPAMTAKVRLNSACMKIARRALQKGETTYTTHQTRGGYQATVKLTCLPGEWAEKVWAGYESNTKQTAEQSAAEIALTALAEDPEMSA